ncbi:non-canonical purine NTP diphosphatase [Tellurirhabdus bombi]|uniref:non-canonical purine NTP diphosphatase n=1 Tax=Tellurirhabdus bombi TaxID=2907205 RepID=UPI001F22CDA6|nr:non-canonical purine NTP diphosphatase [Tellurirhabdus bombi]
MTLCFATNNRHKLEEISALLGDNFTLKTLKEIGCAEEIPETRDTIAGNANQKAEYIWENYQVSCFADDTGLEVDALNGEPGVYSARYAGEERSAAANMKRLLANLEGKKNRQAQFRTVITLALDGVYHDFEGIVRGEILTEPRGTGGFGYDPLFQPLGYDRTFAEMPMDEKGTISHRGIAFAKLIAFLKSSA